MPEEFYIFSLYKKVGTRELWKIVSHSRVLVTGIERYRPFLFKGIRLSFCTIRAN